ncbi:DUF4233 domain-containing protein [Allorhizocola rhizosphaerae]|uniref:DUF4233 domain-containing protein n=1 Tax=Allorhizocola rhizosphaerae TaxID=1872709 RepID=UPI000E3DE5C0|nr:DUF4233 domain-containing protein [Allorhizocola rhizosphaerae]
MSRREVKLLLGGKPSGLRHPSRALRGLASLTLTVEALVLLLSIQPIRVTQDGISMPQLLVVVVGVGAAVLLTGALRWPWGWWAVGGLQVALIATGFLHWTFSVIGIVFGLVWLYVLYVRRRVLL